MRILLLLVIAFVVRGKVCADVISKLVIIVKRSHNGSGSTPEDGGGKETDGQTEDGTDVASKLKISRASLGDNRRDRAKINHPSDC